MIQSVVPNINTPLVDKDGKVTREWHAFFVTLVTDLKNHETRIGDLEP